ncbi:UvrD-helicase domain-containing protein [Pseudomonas sp.]|uniref:UvrD-helicase domain-containing protein n=1 Tax=Pseudomonas sp. TaxID=306 RepID=UPI00326506CE
MTQEWAPSDWGRRITMSSQWRLRLGDEQLELRVLEQVQEIPIEDLPLLRIHQGLFWTDLTFRAGQPNSTRVDGLPNAQTPALQEALRQLLVDSRQRRFGSYYAQICSWLADAIQLIDTVRVKHHWITHLAQQSVLSNRPNLRISDDALWELFRTPEVQVAISDRAGVVERDLKRWQYDWPAVWTRENEQHVLNELVECKDLFDRVESKPLTEEQARAVICFDNRVQAIASAGSGKTSTMVAKAAYGIHRGYVEPASIVMLAFNDAASKELEERAVLSFKRLGMDDTTVQGLTFHKLGLLIIGKAKGRRPNVPTWAVKDVACMEKLTELVDQLKDRSEIFRVNWDLFRLVFNRDLPAVGQSSAADVWDKEGVGQLTTLQGEHVSSQEECIIANWLFYNGVEYKYERAYEYDTATADHRQYYPDFFYPEVSLYHEHLALNGDGQPPAHFEKYLEGVDWKRNQHLRRGTALIETTSHQMRTGELFEHLGKALTDRGIQLDPNPDRPIPKEGRKPMENGELIGLVRTFIRHAKSNSLSPGMMAERLDALSNQGFKYRYRMFLDIVLPVISAWDAALKLEHGIDFESMINEAAECLEQGYAAPYDLVMADEYQDASRARARFCRALVAKPGKYFFAVGDDWQSINRFAGADVSAMTKFREWYGHGQVLRLEQTFRCPQEICDVSSKFVSKNPAQIKKIVRSETPPNGPAIQAFQVDGRGQLSGAVGRYLADLYVRLVDGSIPLGRNGKVSIFILGRYNNDEVYVPEGWKQRYGDRIDLAFRSIHKSKGAEADYVILPAMLQRGFPNLREDDPVLTLAMPEGDTYQHSEERRLFYVALTRARRSVAMFTVKGHSSPFLDELVEEHAIQVFDTEGEIVQEDRCPACKSGVIIMRNGRYGEFRSCSGFPKCSFKPKAHQPHRATKAFR